MAERHKDERPRLERGVLEQDPRREADRLVLAQYGPPGVIINDAMEILHFRGHTGPYLEPLPGVASLHLLKMAREGLLHGLRHDTTPGGLLQAASVMPRMVCRLRSGLPGYG